MSWGAEAPASGGGCPGPSTARSRAAWGQGTGLGPAPGLPASSCGPLSSSPLCPQIDGSTLRTLCMQHGPLVTFHLSLPHGNALVRYGSKEEVVKAQKSLHM